MDICYLSAEEHGRFRNWNIQPKHRWHRHISVEEAADLIRNDVVRVVDGLPAAIVNQDSNNRVWRNVPSAGMKVRQLVRMR